MVWALWSTKSGISMALLVLATRFSMTGASASTPIARRISGWYRPGIPSIMTMSTFFARPLSSSGSPCRSERRTPSGRSVSDRTMGAGRNTMAAASLANQCKGL